MLDAYIHWDKGCRYRDNSSILKTTIISNIYFFLSRFLHLKVSPHNYDPWLSHNFWMIKRLKLRLLLVFLLVCSHSIHSFSPRFTLSRPKRLTTSLLYAKLEHTKIESKLHVNSINPIGKWKQITKIFIVGKYSLI